MSGITPAGGEAGWRVWIPGEGAARVALAAGADGDSLKGLLADAAGLLEGDPDGLMLLARGAVPELDAQLAALAAMGLSGLILDEECAGLLPPPHAAERIGYLPGFGGPAGPRCAFRLRGRTPVPADSPPPVRGQLWSEIRAILSRQAAAGAGRCLRLSGVAGAGKSHLLGAVAGWLGGRGVEVVRVACLPADAPGTFAAWRSLLRDCAGAGLADEIARQGAASGLDPALTRSLAAFLDAPDGEAAALSPLQYKEVVPEFIADLIASRSAAKPCCAILDDIQWMDEAGQQVIGILARRETGPMLVLGRRGVPQEGDLVIGPMAPEETRRLLAEQSGYERITDGLNTEVHRISGGLPLVAREVLKLLGQRKRLLRLGGTLDLAPGDDDAPGRAGMNLSERFHDLPPRPRGLLAACAVWREPFTREQAALATRAAAPEIDFDACWASPLLGEFLLAPPGQAGRFSFYHDLLRVAALSLLGARERRAAHAAALDWMVGEGGRSPAEMAYHAREAGHSRQAMRLFDEAAAAALGRFALREAREAARAAEELDPADDPDGRSRRARRCQVEGEAAFHSGRIKEAVELLEKSLVLYGVSPRPGRFPLGPAVLGRHLWLFARGRPWRGASAGPDLGGASRAALMLAEIAYFEDDQPRSAAACITAMDLALRDGESAALATLIAAIACPMSGKRPGWLATRYRTIARAMVQRIGDEAARAYIEHIGCLVDLGRAAWPDTVSCARRSVAYWRARGHVRRMEEACTFAHYADHFRGELAGAAEWAGILEESAMRRTDGQTQAWAGVVNSVNALARVGTGRAEELAKRPVMDQADAITRLSAHVIRAICAWRRGNPWEAAGHLGTLATEAPAAPSVSSTQFLYAEAALLVAEMRHWGPPELRRDPGFARVTADVRKRARYYARGFRIGMPIWLAALAMGQAMSHPARARLGFGRAERLAARLGMRLLEGRVICLGALSLGVPDRWPEGLALLEECGAAAEIDRFQQLYRDHGRPA
jgi:hypothetical protein